MKAWLLGRNEMVDQGAVPHTFYTDQSGNPEGRDPPPRQAEVFFVNNYGILMDKNGRFSLFQQLIRDLLAAGAPIDGTVTSERFVTLFLLH